jgi:FlaA1/EpsC-like NDP-sugar epimerase
VSRIAKSLFLMALDAAIVMSTPYLSLYIRFEGSVETKYLLTLLNFLPLIVIVRLATFHFFGLYNRIWRYASINELVAIIMAVTASSAVIAAIMHWSIPGFPRSIYLLSWVFDIVLIGGSRLGVRVLYHIRQRQASRSVNVLIVGAGDAGAMIAREIQQRVHDDKRVIGFIDDDIGKHNQMLYGAKVLGTRYDIVKIVANCQVQEIIIAMPSIGGRLLRQIMKECRKTNCAIKVVPGLYELIDGKASVDQLRDVDLEDLLRREPVRLDLDEIASYLAGKRVLVTGAGGSVGSELCRQIARLGPASLVLLGKGENSIYEIDRELRGKHSELAITPVIADIRDTNRINNVFNTYKPEVVFHAAAHKHVPLMESQPEEAVSNNVFGTKVVAEAAERSGTAVFVMISTDKAVNPTSIMGATKRLAELVIQNIGKKSKTKFIAVRFGNVLGSRGSVIPLFKQQIAAGGPVTVTHPEMTRYFMTIPEAAQLVLQAGAIAKGGEVFVLDMGEPVQILDLAHDLIELSGFTPETDIPIVFTGIRPGEKLFEELLTAEEGTQASKHEKIHVANLRPINKDKLSRGLQRLRTLNGQEDIIYVLEELVPYYRESKARHGGKTIKDTQRKKEHDDTGECYKPAAQ